MYPKTTRESFARYFKSREIVLEIEILNTDGKRFSSLFSVTRHCCNNHETNRKRKCQRCNSIRLYGDCQFIIIIILVDPTHYVAQMTLKRFQKTPSCAPSIEILLRACIGLP